jgi:D-arabinose 1-dehydrogenase-like Zn-dependent alcohol dehydrogenase
MYCENDSFNGLTTDGGFAEEMRTGERSVIPLPDGVDPAEVAPHADAGITAYHAVRKAVDELAPGDTAVVIGVGGLGHIGLQCLDAMSAADIVALDIKESARELAAECGADVTLDPQSVDVAAEVEDLTDGHGAEQVLDFVGADETTALGPEIAALGGEHHVVGYGGHVHEPAQAFVAGEFTYRGTLVGRYSELQELVALVDRGDVDLRTSRYDLGAINEAAERLENREIEGRAVITP